MKHLVLGGVRSGKSQFAERWIAKQQYSVCYLATSQVFDEGMADRVAKHRAHRPEHWQLIEEPLYVAKAFARIQSEYPDHGVILECCSLWLTNLLIQEDESQYQKERTEFLNAVAAFKGHLIMVSAEVGLGIMPMNALARRYGDEIGTLNQQLAQLCDQVTFVTAGLPMTLK